MQSSLAPAGREAERIAALFWWMSGGLGLVWLGMIVLALRYGRPHPEAPSRTRDRWLIIGAGVIFPIIVLTGLLVYGLLMLPPLVARAPEGSLQIDVDGEEWWWRVRYFVPGHSPIVLANEVRLPVGEPVQFRLRSDNVIHSFWIPALGGKMDMIPGRVTHLALTPTATGVFSGACAEYCGLSHAFMRFSVQVMEKAAFDRWLRDQASPARTPTSDAAERGRQLLLANGCGACHTVRGTRADGEIAPDLTHVGSRISLAAATLPNDAAALRRWLAESERVKPGVHMPRFDMLPAEDLRALAVYLEGLK
jgi:cytochrome c oxidase subunit 2